MPKAPSELIRAALELAKTVSPDDLPIAAIIVDGSGNVIGSSRNRVGENLQSTAHAELLALAEISLPILKQHGHQMTLAVTLEPCPMCAWAIRLSGIGRVVFGAFNPKYGAAGSVYDMLRDKGSSRRIEVIAGVLAGECSFVLGNTFLQMRDNGQR